MFRSLYPLHLEWRLLLDLNLLWVIEITTRIGLLLLPLRVSACCSHRRKVVAERILVANSLRFVVLWLHVHVQAWLLLRFLDIIEFLIGLLSSLIIEVRRFLVVALRWNS